MDGDIGDGQETATPDSEPVARANQRTGTAERQAAVNALSEHSRAGRITTQEYEERSEVAKRAVTWADIDALFTDLPQPHPAPGRSTGPLPVSDQVLDEPPRPVLVPSGPPPVLRDDRDVETDRGLVPHAVGNWLMVLATPVAAVLFFTTYQWWWWMLIPVVSMVVYGPKEKGHRRHR